MDFTLLGVSGPSFHLLHIRLGLVHVKTIDSGSSSELGAWLATRWVRSVWIRTGLALVESRTTVLLGTSLLFFMDVSELVSLSAKLSLDSGRLVSLGHFIAFIYQFQNKSHLN